MLRLRKTIRQDTYIIEELYHPVFKSYYCYNGYVALWQKNQKIKFYERDIYKRRLNLFGNIFTAYYPLSKEDVNYYYYCITLKRVECMILYEMSILLKFR